jgi:putative restriction endonuclease
MLVLKNMQAYIGVTDYSWFDLLRKLPEPEEINFWQPGGNQVFKALKPGELFLFKLHYPYNKIVGGGFFAYSTLLPVSLAWESFETKNGVNDLLEMRRRIGKLRHQKENAFTDYTIGCILLEQPFFFSEKDWLPAPPDWKPNIVQGKKYDLSSGYGLSLWKQLHLNSLLTSVEKDPQMPLGVQEEQVRYGSPVTTYPRLGQGSFRVLVTDIYKRRCAVTQEKTLPALDVAHILPYSESGRHVVNNGILLRRDLHALFDQGYVTITPSLKFQVSNKIKEEFENGRDYYSLQGRELWLPDNPANRPSQEYIKWHNNNRYLI